MSSSDYKYKTWVDHEGITRHRRIPKKTIKLGDQVQEEVEEFDLSEDDLEDMANSVTDIEHVMDAYDDDELSVVDEDGEEAEEIKEELEPINEVLSRIERMRARIRFAKTAAKRERKIQIALKRHSSQPVINKRSKRLAIEMFKKRIAKKDPSKMSVAEKERVERMVQKNPQLINRLAMKLAPRVRKIEQQRLTHKVYTK